MWMISPLPHVARDCRSNFQNTPSKPEHRRADAFTPERRHTTFSSPNKRVPLPNALTPASRHIPVQSHARSFAANRRGRRTTLRRNPPPLPNPQSYERLDARRGRLVGRRFERAEHKRSSRRDPARTATRLKPRWPPAVRATFALDLGDCASSAGHVGLRRRPVASAALGTHWRRAGRRATGADAARPELLRWRGLTAFALAATGATVSWRLAVQLILVGSSTASEGDSGANTRAGTVRLGAAHCKSQW
jgi:hypothetical protein